MLGKTILYSYFDGGNIRSKREYAYTTDTEPSDWDVKISYEYDTAWKDKLVEYDGETITYDEIGDVVSVTWQKGRQLSQTKRTSAIQFKL